MESITDLRNKLIRMFNALEEGTADPKQAVELNNTAGKILGTAKVQLGYAALRGEIPEIPFLSEKQANPVLSGKRPIIGDAPPEVFLPSKRRKSA